MKFMPWFHESEELCGKKYEVMFTINRCRGWGRNEEEEFKVV